MQHAGWVWDLGCSSLALEPSTAGWGIQGKQGELEPWEKVGLGVICAQSGLAEPGVTWLIMVWAHPQSTHALGQDPVTVTITAPALLDKGAGTDAETTAAAPSSHITPQGLSQPCVCTQENLNFSGPPFSQHCPVQEKFPLVILVNFFLFYSFPPTA